MDDEIAYHLFAIIDPIQIRRLSVGNGVEGMVGLLTYQSKRLHLNER
jgi:hypothetical protein